MDIEQIKKIFTAYNVILDMLADRGYKIPLKLKNEMDINIFSKEFDEDMKLTFDKENKESIIVYIFNDSDIKKKDIIKTLEMITEEHKAHNILLTAIKFQTNLKDEVSTQFNKNVELFLIKNLLFNPTKHILQPDFRLISEEEKKELLEKYKCKELQLPWIKITDPITKYYDAKPGQVFRIDRNNMNKRNKTSGQGIGYRIVVE